MAVFPLHGVPFLCHVHKCKLYGAYSSCSRIQTCLLSPQNSNWGWGFPATAKEMPVCHRCLVGARVLPIGVLLTPEIGIRTGSQEPGMSPLVAAQVKIQGTRAVWRNVTGAELPVCVADTASVANHYHSVMVVVWFWLFQFIPAICVLRLTSNACIRTSSGAPVKSQLLLATSPLAPNHSNTKTILLQGVIMHSRPKDLAKTNCNLSWLSSIPVGV